MNIISDKLGINENEFNIDEIMKKIDIDGNGELDIKEFIAATI